MRIVLASASPRRRELLAILNLPYEIISSPCDEESLPKLRDGRKFALQAAQCKAEAISEEAPNGIIIAADTVVFLGRAILGKPKDEADAVRMLRMLSGKTHSVTTGLCVLRRENGATVKKIVDAPVTFVTFRRLTDQAIQRYIETKEPFDKAGAYGIQGYGALLIDSVQGCYYNVVGLPISRLARHLYTLGQPVWTDESYNR